MTSTSRDDNPSAFKHVLNSSVVSRMAKSLARIYPSFPSAKFKRVALELPTLELKQRVQVLSRALREHLPKNYVRAVALLVKSAHDKSMNGFALWPYLDFVQRYGIENPQVSLQAMYKLTPLFSAEFAIRPFLIAQPRVVWPQLQKWIKDPDPHIRRWLSEGTRPRLPWGERLVDSVKDPSLGLKILEALKFDESIYVRKSVANHLNDIAKDHPKLVLQTLRRWQGSALGEEIAKVDWIMHRALRTLIKNGDPGALSLLGAPSRTQVELAQFKLVSSVVRYPGSLDFSFKLESTSNKAQLLIVDYIVHHVRGNKETTPKVFKLKKIKISPAAVVQFTKRHALRPISTRRYYPGEHGIEIQVNGQVLGRKKWTLLL